jgi:anti-anti-sigma factor
VTVAGEIDMSNADRFRDALGLAAGAAADGGSFVVDLSGVEYLDSAGVHVLFAHAARIRLIAGPLLEPVLTISGLSDITSVSDDSRRERQ